MTTVFDALASEDGEDVSAQHLAISHCESFL
jgi:hypothetical protein